MDRRAVFRNGFLIAAFFGLVRTLFSDYGKIRAKLGVGNKAELTRAALLGRKVRDAPARAEDRVSDPVEPAAPFTHSGRPLAEWLIDLVSDDYSRRKPRPSRCCNGC